VAILIAVQTHFFAILLQVQEKKQETTS